MKNSHIWKSDTTLDVAPPKELLQPIVKQTTLRGGSVCEREYVK